MKTLKSINKLAYLVTTLCTSLIFAQEEASWLKGFKLSGNADIFYKADFAGSDNNTKTSFTAPNNSFELGMFSLKLTHSSGKFTTVADLGFGNRAEQFSYTADNTKFLIKQLYIDYAATDKLTLTGGSWATHVGYELLDAPENDIYSMSYAFSYGPFLHTGFKANYVASKFNFMAGVVNPTDFKSAFHTADPNTGESFKNKFFIWQIGYAGDQLSAYLNGQHGSYNPWSNNVSQFDLTAAYKFTDKFKLGINATTATFSSDTPNVGKQTWSSLVGYLKYDVSEGFALNYRAEYLDNKDNALALGAANGNTVFANTISATLRQGNFQLKPEIRFESSNEDIYFKKDGSATGSSANFLIGAMYKF